MVRRFVASLTLLAFINCLAGCVVSSVDKIPQEAAQIIAPSEKIVELVLLDGTTVKFDNLGGKFDTVAREVIQGPSAHGDTLLVPLSEIWQCRTSPPETLALAELDTAHIAEVVLADNSLVSFEPPGATYSKKTGKISGSNFRHPDLTFQLNELRSIRSHRPALMRSDSLKRQPETRVYEVVDKHFSVFTFDSSGGRLTDRIGFHGRCTDGTYVDVPADAVLYAGVERTDPVASAVASLGVVVGVIGVIALIVMSTKQSCPFVYAFDGQQYVFDAEPLGGAICPGLARTDISRLDFVKPVAGEYRLLVRNEVPETQYIDRMALLLVDHAPGTAVYPDLKGKFYQFRNILDATSSTDEKGMSLMNFLRASDNVTWQTHLPSASADTGQGTRHEITVTLPRVPGAKKAWLITNIGTSSWGSNMIRKTVEYRGSTAKAWLASLTPGSQSLTEMNQFLEREEMYHLKAWLKEGTSWHQVTTILGQGPLISEDRVYPIDVSAAAGDSLVLRFQPPKGFWTFDYIGVSYDEPSVIDPVRINASRAEDQQGTSLLRALNQKDSVYYAMPEVGDHASLHFSAPPNSEGTIRSVYLETSGYYELHLKKDLPDQLARLYTIGANPGQIVKTAMEEYRAWQAGLQLTGPQSQPDQQ